MWTPPKNPNNRVKLSDYKINMITSDEIKSIPKKESNSRENTGIVGIHNLEWNPYIAINASFPCPKFDTA